MTIRPLIATALLCTTPLVSACARNRAVTKSDVSIGGGSDPSPALGPASSALGPRSADSGSPHTGPEAIYFAFDSADLESAERPTLERIATNMRSDRSQRLRIEGHCDDVGTVEYNLSLGQQRADVAKQHLVRLGIDGTRIESVSYGKERPKHAGTDEDSRAKNRRDDFLYRAQ